MRNSKKRPAVRQQRTTAFWDHAVMMRPLAAAIVATGGDTATTVTVSVATANQNQNKDDDPGAVATTEEVVTHNILTSLPQENRQYRFSDPAFRKWFRAAYIPSYADIAKRFQNYE